MKSISSIAFLLIISGFCFGQSDSVSFKTNEIEKLNENSISPVQTPKFSNETVQQFADEYRSFYDELINAVKAGDQTKLSELQITAVQWAQRAQEITTKMTPEDAQLWVEWSQKLAKAANE